MNKCAIKLKELRLEKGLTIAQLSKLLNISTRTLVKYEKTGAVYLKTLIKMCIIFNVRLDYILGLSDIKLPVKPYKFTIDDIK